jgi:hypothetical protein
MSKITEVNAGGEATPGLICPLMSGQLVPTNPKPGEIATPGQVILRPTIVTCACEKCRWWDESAEQCIAQIITGSLLALSRSLPEVTAVLEPPTKSPLVRISYTLDQIWKMLDRIELLYRTKAPTKEF